MVADKDHGHAFGLEFFEHGKECINLLAGERGSRLIQDEDARVHGQRLGDFHELLLGHAQLTHRHVQIHVQADKVQCRLCLCPEVLAIDQPKTAWGPPEHDVFGHGHGGHKVEFLVNGGDAQRLRGLGIWDFHLCAIYQDAAGIWRVHTGNHLDEGRFSRAVLTQQGLHLAAADGEVYPLMTSIGPKDLVTLSRRKTQSLMAWLHRVGGQWTCVGYSGFLALRLPVGAYH